MREISQTGQFRKFGKALSFASSRLFLPRRTDALRRDGYSVFDESRRSIYQTL
jgi:hypothetical protein